MYFIYIRSMLKWSGLFIEDITWWFMYFLWSRLSLPINVYIKIIVMMGVVHLLASVIKGPTSLKSLGLWADGILKLF